jgi:psiF repeat
LFQVLRYMRWRSNPPKGIRNMFAMVSKLSTAAAVLVVSAGLAFAQAPGASPSPSTGAAAGMKAPAKGAKKASTPEGIECSAQADAKSLKGKERKSFRSKCISAMKKGSKAGAPKAATKS